MTLFPGSVVCPTVEEVRDVFVDKSLLRVVHGFESFWWDAIKTWCFPLFEFGDGPLNFAECDWDVDVGKSRFLRNEVKDRVIDWAVVVEYFVEV